MPAAVAALQGHAGDSRPAAWWRVNNVALLNVLLVAADDGLKAALKAQQL
jgi:hypothetical protein